MTAIRAGLYYFASVYFIGFILGAVRVTVVAPRLGETLAVFLELPLMMAASWLFSRMIVRDVPVASRSQDRLIMGGAALSFLIVVETAMGQFVFHRDLAAQLASLGRPAGILGLAGQILFALFPWIQGVTSKS